MSFTYYPDRDSSDYLDAMRERDREKAAMNWYCGTCDMRGTHRVGCPENIEEEEAEQHE